MSRLLPTLLVTAALATAKPTFGTDSPFPPSFPGYVEKTALSFDWFDGQERSRNGRVFMFTRNKNVVFRQDESTKRSYYASTFIRFGNPGAVPFPEGSSYDGWYNGSCESACTSCPPLPSLPSVLPARMAMVAAGRNSIAVHCFREGIGPHALM
jgi:hypothetical protein